MAARVHTKLMKGLSRFCYYFRPSFLIYDFLFSPNTRHPSSNIHTTSNVNTNPKPSHSLNRTVSSRDIDENVLRDAFRNVQMPAIEQQTRGGQNNTQNTMSSQQNVSSVSERGRVDRTERLQNQQHQNYR